MPETSTTSIRLTEQDRANAAVIVETGAATDIASAIRVGLALAAWVLRASPRRVARDIAEHLVRTFHP